MAVYDMALCMMRAYLAFGYRRRAGKGASYELRCYRRTAVMLFLFHILDPDDLLYSEKEVDYQELVKQQASELNAQKGGNN